MKYYDTFYDCTEFLKEDVPTKVHWIAGAIQDVKDRHAQSMKMIPISFMVGEECIMDICGERTTPLL